ncbi:PTS system protein [Parelusimicrobium proximum]|uniref:PTS sugar transporter subunit IIA n=1 Tax=Parelusimicrobium proximum TaxID=3228953 RepID=UPI003D185366
MINIVIIAHGSLSKFTMETVSDICKMSSENVYTFSTACDSDVEQLAEELRKIFEEGAQEDGTLVLADLFGGSGANVAALMAHDCEKTYVISGLNMNMVFSALYNRGKLNIDELAGKVESDGRKGIMNITKFMQH